MEESSDNDGSNGWIAYADQGCSDKFSCGQSYRVNDSQEMSYKGKIESLKPGYSKLTDKITETMLKT